MHLPLTSAGTHGAPTTSRAERVALVALCAVAALLRLWRLGALGLEVDEGVQGLAVQGWLASGLPILPSGMMYQRAIPFGALQALMAGTIGLGEFALRLPAALFGVLSVAVTFALARALFDRRIAWVAAIFIALSAWEIELSRYARFYTAFQVTYVLALLCFYRALSPGARAWRWAFAAAALAAMTFHELAIVLITCFAVPLFDRAATRRTRIVALASAIPFVVAWLAYRRGFVRWFVGLAPPHGLEFVQSAATPQPGSALLLPGIPPLRVPEAATILLDSLDVRLVLLASLLVGVVAALSSLRQAPPAAWWSGLLPVGALALGAIHQFLAAGFLLSLFLALTATSLRDVWSRQLRPVIVALAMMLVIWSLVLPGQLQGDAKAILLSLFGFPNVLQYFVYWFALGWPLFLIAVTAAAVIMFERFLRTGDRAALFLLSAVVPPLMIASMFDAYFESRYVFHLYPLLVILFAWGLVRLGDRLATLTRRQGNAALATRGAVLALGFLASGDVGSGSWAPLTRDYASHRDPIRSIISWRAYASFHQDQQGPSRLVRDSAGPADVVAAIGVPHQLAVYRFYMGRLDVALSRPENRGYQRMRNGQIIDWVTGSELVFDAKELVRTSPTATTWLLGDEVILGDVADYFAAHVRRDAQPIVRDRTLTGRDGVTFLLRQP